MAVPSSLLKAAQSQRDKVRAYEDSVAAFAWENSAKTLDDWNDYQRYLQERAENTTDPSDNLTYQRKLRSAENQYVSQEIERASIAVLEGRGTTTDKYNKMVELFYQAIDRGNLDLAQNLQYRLGSLSIQIQNEQERAQRVAGTMALNRVKELDDLVKKLQSGEDFIRMSDGSFVKPLRMVEKELSAQGDTGTGFWGDVMTTLESMYGLVEDAYMSATTQEAVNQLENKYGALLRGERAFTIAGKRMNFQEVRLAYESDKANNPIYSPIISRDPITGQTTFELRENRVGDFVWTLNDEGLYQMTPMRVKTLSANQSLSTQITDEGAIIGQDGSVLAGTGQVDRDSSLSIQNRLLSQGWRVDNNTLISPTGEQFNDWVVGSDGRIRFMGLPGEFSGGLAGLYELDAVTGQMREVAPDETSDFGVRSPFGGMLSMPTERGRNYIQNLAGLSQASAPKPIDLNRGRITGIGSPFLQTSKPLNILNDFSGRGASVTGNILQGAQVRRDDVAEALMQQQRAQQLLQQQQQAQRAIQQANAPGLQQTPVRAFSILSGAPVKQIKVAPLPQRKAPIPVSVSKPSTKKISVGTASGSSKPIKIGF